MQLCVAGCLPHLTAVMTPAGATSGEASTCIDELSRLKIIAVIIVIPADNENQCLSSTACAAIVTAQTVLSTGDSIRLSRDGETQPVKATMISNISR